MTIINITIPTISGVTSVLSVNGWFVMQQRLDAGFSFNYSWIDYRNGFGQPQENFWLGNEKMYQLTTVKNWKLRFEMMIQTYGWMSAEYEYFTLTDESANYTINLDAFSGDCSNAMMYTGGTGQYNNNGMPFTTYDVKHDLSQAGYNCAAGQGGGWWYNHCYNACLNAAASHPNAYVWGSFTQAVHKLNVTRMMMKMLS